ncbi:hypothetical protein PhCBS80983_g04722 [Powellomyces hirtus]|uniref:Uncharacterized protein n=1 Tax=Powellomyces hirtus TaxID=109895 RepID=A0A507DWS5_9FUNG|nr:hypothetical protein PhCBS80983_g04722 [Powellomyces hirtus]
MEDPFGYSPGRDTPSRRGLKKLKFTQRIVPLTVGKPIPTAELVTRLKKLHNDLANMEQEDVDTQSLMTVQKDLRSPSLMSHKDKGVKVLTACCLAEILRLFAPDAPYSQNQLRDIFEFFAKQLQNLSDKEGPYYNKYFALLDSLSTVKSVVLVADLNADDLVIDFFKTFFDLLKFDLAKPVTIAMVDILQQLVDECPHLPQDVVDTILMYFRKQEERPNAYKLATDLCNASPERLQRYVCQHFTDAIMAAGRGFAEDHEEEEWRDAHKLILEINRAAPAVLLNVIPLLDEELKLEDVNVRTLATNVLGEMFSVQSSVLAKKYPQVWKSWLGRRVDKHSSVRLAWLGWCLPLIRNHPELALELEACMKEKCIDPDEKVRAAVLKVVGQLDAATAHNISPELVSAAGERLRDKKVLVREAAVDALSQLYNLKYAEVIDSSTGEASAELKYGWIPGAILEMLYIDDADNKVLVEKALYDQIFPPNTDDAMRTERLLNVVASWSEKQRKAFMNVLDRQAKTMEATAAFVDYCEKFNGGVMDTGSDETEKLLLQIITYIAARFPDPKKAQAQLQKFSKANDGRTYKLLRSIMDFQSEYKPLIKNIKELIKRLEQQTGVMETFTILLRRISLTIVAKSSISILIDKIQTSRRTKDETAMRLGQTAEKLLKDISTVFPALYRSNLEQFKELLHSPDDTLVADSLEALARFARVFPEEAPRDSESKERLKKFALEGTPAQAKNAIAVLAHMRDDSLRTCGEVLEIIMQNLSFDNQSLITHLAALAQLAQDTPVLFEAHYPAVTNFVVKDLLFVNRRKRQVGDIDWVEYEELEPEGVMKVMGIRILVKRLVAIASESNVDSAVPVMKLLRRLIEYDGEIVAERTTPPAVQTHLRLIAGVSLLKLARCPTYAAMLTFADVHKLGLVMQDTIYHVRNKIIEKLVLYLSNKAVPFEYHVILMLAAHELELELRNKVKNFLIRRIKQQRTEQDSHAPMLEHTLARFLHLLAHHPDFSLDAEVLVVFAVYIGFFLDVVATAENASFLYHMAAKLKTMRDLHAERSDNLYVLSDLAQLVIQEKANQAGWSLPSYQGSVRLPKDLFGKLSDRSMAEVARKSYLPQALVDLRAKNAASGPHGNRSRSGKRDPATAAKLAVVKANASVTSTPDVTDDEGRGAEDGSMTPGAKRKGRPKATSASSARKRRKSAQDDDDDESDQDERSTRPLPVETPQRKNAPRSARKTQTFKEMSDEEADEEPEEDARPEKVVEADSEEEDDDQEGANDADAQSVTSESHGLTARRRRQKATAVKSAAASSREDRDGEKENKTIARSGRTSRKGGNTSAFGQTPAVTTSSRTSRSRKMNEVPTPPEEEVGHDGDSDQEDDEPLSSRSRPTSERTVSVSPNSSTRFPTSPITPSSPVPPPSSRTTTIETADEEGISVPSAEPGKRKRGRPAKRAVASPAKKKDSGIVASDEGAAPATPPAKRKLRRTAKDKPAAEPESDSDEGDRIPVRRVTRRHV